MKLANSIQKEQRKKENKRKREQFIQKMFQTVIGVPGTKIINTYYQLQENTWKKDEEKSKQKVVNELANYIKKEIAREQMDNYFIYNDWRHEDIDYGNALHLHYFVYESQKYSKNMRIFNRIFRENGNKKEYYQQFYDALLEHFSYYEDIEVETGVQECWNNKYEYIKLTLKTEKES